MKFVGIESGGTRSWGAYGDLTVSRRLELPADVGSISGTRTDDELASTFKNFFGRIKATCFDEEAVIWISAAGFAISTAQRLCDLAQDAANQSRVMGHLYLANDATTLMLLPPRRGSGVVAIIGTGSVVLAAHQGEMRKFSGDEWIASDIGAGVQIGLQGIREAYGKFQGWKIGTQTGLDEDLRTWIEMEIGKHSNPLNLPPSVLAMSLDAQIPYAMRSLASFGSNLKSLVAGFAPYVLHQSTRSDEVAIMILDQATQEVAELIYGQCEWVRARDATTYGDKFLVCLDGYLGGSYPYISRMKSAIDDLSKSAPTPLRIEFEVVGTASFPHSDSTGIGSDASHLSALPAGPPSLDMARLVGSANRTLQVSLEMGARHLLLDGS
jgi:N-acetylglucosamine kinase-like BadF-type ATPase